MPVGRTTLYAKPELAALDLAVTVSGMTITVGQGAFKHNGADEVLDDDVDHVVTADPTNPTNVLGYLVRVKADSSIDVVVDEVVEDGVDEVYAFDDASPYEFLHLFYYVEVPANETNLEDLLTATYPIEEQIPDRVHTQKARPDNPFVPPSADKNGPLGLSGQE